MKTKTYKAETAKQFLTENRDTVFSTLKSIFWNRSVDFKILVNDYFNYVIESRYNEYFVCEMEIKTISKVISNSVEAFHFTTDYPKNYNAINDWEDRRRAASRNSISY